MIRERTVDDVEFELRNARHEIDQARDRLEALLEWLPSPHGTLGAALAGVEALVAAQQRTADRLRTLRTDPPVTARRSP